VNVSVKVSALYSQFDPLAFDESVERAAERLIPLLELAKRRGVFVNIDMEHYALKDLTYALFKRAGSDPKLDGYEHMGVVVQAYLRDSEADLLSLIEWAKQHKKRIVIRLVKGAYWDYETIHATQEGWPSPVWLDKADSDAQFERLTDLMLKNHQHLRSAIASHNLRSVAFALATAERYKVPQNGFEIQCLYGMAEPIKAACAAMGLRVRTYAPVGELIPGMAYLVRRLLENTSNEGWLRQSVDEGADTNSLLAQPAPKRRAASMRAVPPERSTLEALEPFCNEPLRDFARADQRAAFSSALERVRQGRAQGLGGRVHSHIKGAPFSEGEVMRGVNPSQPAEVIVEATLCGEAQVEEAVQCAREAWPAWSARPTEERVSWLLTLASLMRAQRDELAAVMVCEVGKTWREADADVAEAIDFCEYYAREALRLSAPKLMQRMPGELNHLSYVSRGVCAVISPWNFPLAILVGMSTAAAVTGNAVIVKPAEQSMLIASRFVALAHEAGAPPEALQLMFGRGEVVGAALCRHPHVSTIAFTGSRAVGLEIYRQAGITHPGQPSLKRVVCEMGGKNALIVDSDADLDEAVLGVARSAFGFAGQKCSACSRVIVVEPLYELFVARLKAAVESMLVGDARDPKVSYGPVIEEEAFARLASVIEQGRARGEVLTGGVVGGAAGYFIRPTLIAGLEWDDPITQEEHFGPVVTLHRAATFEEALERAQGTEYALTGGLFSRSPSHIQMARERYIVGNLYINRTITGAVVGRQPFGGFKMSGGGTKAGGPDYLLQFLNGRSITENTQRRGFAPEE
jgi:RHH-type proline utilization regulon transcriptional repressor/proline dehydrogenase/delta 1-pyrroline-5-carboxylate dehydrogenase